MCDIKQCDNCCHEEDLLCCCPVMHCCGGYSEHNNCCPHNRGCCNQCCGGPCGGCCDCCYMKYYKLLQKYKDEIDQIINDIKIDINDLRSWYEMLNNRLIEIYNNFSQDITNINNRITKLDGEAIKKITLSSKSSVVEPLTTTSYLPENGIVTLPIYKQSDWNVDDDTKWAFIKNKPTRLSQFENDGFIKNIHIYSDDYTPNEAGSVTLPNFAKKVKVGSNTAVAPNSSGVVELDAYPTASDLDVPNKIQLSMSGDDRYILTASLKRGSTTISSSDIDLPLEEMIVNASYNNTTKKLRLTLKNGTYIDVDIADIISGLVTKVKIGNDTPISPDSNGVIQLPAYPASQVNSDWNSTTGVSKILNKPDLSQYENVQSDWNVTNSNSSAYIKNKPDLTTKADKTEAVGDITFNSSTGQLTVKSVNGTTLRTIDLLWKDDSTNGTLKPVTSSRSATANGFYDSSVS